MGATFSRVKTWVSTEDLEYDDLNAEFDNILTNLTPAGMDDYSANTTQARLQTSPGTYASPSLATTAAGELERLRYTIGRIIGGSNLNWLDTPPSSITSLVSALGNTLAANRIISGRERTDSSQPIFLVPHGAARTVTLKGATTNFSYSINSTEYSITTDVTATSLVAAPTSNNTCLVNDAAAADQEYTKFLGENGTEITIDNVGTEFTALIGKFIGFKIAGTTDEYAIGLMGTNKITDCWRGYFFDSSDAPIPRAGFTNNDTITLMKLTWVYANTSGALAVSYTNPIFSATEPGSPASGDYWFDSVNSTWKTFNGSAFVSADATPVGICLQDGTNTVAARSFDFSLNFEALNTIGIEYSSTTQVKSTRFGGQANVYGSLVDLQKDSIAWDITTDLETGITEAASTKFYIYLTETGGVKLSSYAPYNRNYDLRGIYHPYHAWRCLGWAYNNGSSNIAEVDSYYRNAFQPLLIEPERTAAFLIDSSKEFVPLNSSGGAFAAYLPPAAYWRGKRIIIQKVNAELNAITLTTFGSENFTGNFTAATTYQLWTKGEVVTLLSDGTSIKVIGHESNTEWVSNGVIAIGATTTAPTKADGITIDRMLWRREGKDLIGRLEYAQSNTTNAVAGSGDYLFTAVPTGITIDSSLVTFYTTVESNGVYGSTNWVGAASFNTGTVCSAGGVVAYGTTQVRLFGVFDNGGKGAMSSGGVNLTIAGISAIAEYRVPITEWKA